MGINSLKRKDKIKDLLNRKGRVFVSELVSALDVSEVSIRRYLKELEEENFLLRTYGGAVKNENGILAEFFFGEKEKKNLAEKKAIAKMAYNLIKSGETIFLDTGTTTLEISKLIVRNGKNLLVVTTSLPVVSELSRTDDLKVFVLGGFLRKELMDFSGPFSVGEIARLAFDQVFLGVDGISGDKGLTTTDTVTAEMEGAVMKKTHVVNVVADFSKIGKESLISYGNIESKNICKRLITDSRADRKELEKIRKAGFEVKIAQLEENER